MLESMPQFNNSPENKNLPIKEKIFSENNNNPNYWSVLDEYFPEYSSLRNIDDIALHIKYDGRVKDLDIALFDSLWWGDTEKAMPILALLITICGVEATRKKINENIGENPSKNFGNSNQDRFNSDHVALRSLITPELKPAKIDSKNGELITEEKDKEKIEHIINLRNFYNAKIKFEDYDVNERMNAKEVELLQSLIGKDEKVLEEGCGTGRLFLEMKKAGYDISGFDFTKRHIDLIKEKDPEAKVDEGDWHKTEFSDAEFDAVYSLGRNILHDYSIVDQAATFREAARILKLGGKLFFDIPNREKGGYKEMTEEYAREMKERGIRNFRYGTIYDSPNGIDFATRYAYSPEDIEQLARLTGFRIVKVEKRELETGKDDENIYYVLEKISQPVSGIN